MKNTKAQLDTKSGVADPKDRVKQGIAGVKAFAAADLEQTKADFKRVHDRLARSTRRMARRPSGTTRRPDVAELIVVGFEGTQVPLLYERS